MADGKRYIAVDLGVTYGKVALASVSSSGLVNMETVYEFPVPTVRIGGGFYWDIYAAYAEVLKGLSAVGERRLPIDSLGISAWSHGLVCVAKDGTVLSTPRIFPEVLSESVQGKFFKRMDRRELYETSGVNILDSHAALQLFAMRREKSVALDDTKYIFPVADAFVFLLTGKRSCGYTSLSAAGLVDRRTGKLSRDIAGAAKVRPRRFPSMVQPGAKLAKLTEEISESTGLSRIPVTAVPTSLASAASALPETLPTLAASPSGTSAGASTDAFAGTYSDTFAGSSPQSVSSPHSASTGRPALSTSDRTSLHTSGGSAFLLSGAISVLGIETEAPVVNDQTFEMNFSNEAGAGGVNLLLKRIAGADLLERCLAQWRRAGRAYGPEDLARMAREGAATSAQLDPEDPSLLTVADAPAAIARYCSLRSMEAPVDDAAIVRLVYTSLAEKYGDTFLKLQSVTPFRIKSLHLLGEASLDPVLCQLVSDECGVPVLAGPVDAALLGSVLTQSGLTRRSLTTLTLRPTPAVTAPITFSPVLYSPGL